MSSLHVAQAQLHLLFYAIATRAKFRQNVMIGRIIPWEPRGGAEMALKWRCLTVIFQAILLICAGCGPHGPTTSTSTTAPLPRPGAAPTESTNESTVRTDLPDKSQAASVPLSDPLPAQTEVESKETATAESEILHDTFADASGAIHWNRDGAKSAEGAPSQRTIYFFNGTPEGGPLVMRIFEDGAVNGPDGKPGVLALSWQEIPAKLPYSGFVYLGGRIDSERLTLPLLKQAKSTDDLRQFRLKFRYKGANELREGPFSLNVGCRLEPVLADSYTKRLDLGAFTVTGEWGNFEMSLAEGKNSEAFLRAIADENPPAFKIIWSQAGSLADYRPGDTLLIDDIVITSSTTE